MEKPSNIPKSLFLEATGPASEPESTGRFSDVSNSGMEFAVRRPIELANDALASSLGVLRLLADAVRGNFQDFDSAGREMSAEIKVALEFSTEIKAWVVKGSGKGSLEVTITVPLTPRT